eukprot:c24779_g1_i1 orf=352-1422(-)
MCAHVNDFTGNVPGTYFLPRLNPIPVPLGLASRKRSLEGEVEYGSGPAKRPDASSEVVFRLLVSASRIGKVIGKQGSQIRQLREETGANIKIADASTTFEDRVVVISSKEEVVNGLRSAAEYALVRVATVVIEERGDDNISAKVMPQHQNAPNLTRLLIGRSQAGCLIGKGGANIKDIREGTGASVRILPSDQLPMCSCSSQTDRLVQISGDLVQVQKALELIASRLRENPSKEAIVSRPMHFGSRHMPYGQSAYLGYGSNSLAGGTVPFGGLNLQAVVVPLVPKVSAEMSVPCTLIGGVIGRGGAKITQIRTFTGCAVKVFDQQEGEMERKIAFEGTAEQVSAAQSLVQAFMSEQ